MNEFDTVFPLLSVTEAETVNVPETEGVQLKEASELLQPEGRPDQE